MKNDNPKRLLIVSAHADDHIPCAGTAIKLRNAGYEVYEIVFTNSNMGGDQSKEDKDYINKPENEDLRTKEYKAAAKFLGVKKTHFMHQQDLGLEFTHKLMLETARIIGEIKPEIALIPPAEDWHIDHRTAHQIAREAFKWANTGVGGRHKTKIVLAYEATVPLMHDVVVDITEVYDEKIKLMQKYESQFKSMKMEEYIASVRGYQVRRQGTEKAEGFKTIPGELPSLLFD